MNTKKLKELVLDLAIHGKLVQQDPNDEPASVLLERIQAEKTKTAKGKKSITSEPIEEVPFEVPVGWCWTPLKDICSKLVDGDHNPPKGENNPTRYLMASSKNINNNRLVDLNDVRYLSEDVFIECDKRTEVSIGDIAITSVGTLGRSCIIDKDYKITFQRSVTVISLIQVLNYFVKYYFDSPYIQNFMSENSRGTAQQGFYINQMEVLLIPLPPLSEQRRIVAEIERWFKVIDALEGNEGDLLKSIEQTKKKVLDLAIHGKLVQQDTNDEPASVALKKINPKAEIITENEDFGDIPQGWCLCLLNSVSTVARGGSPRPIKSFLTTADDGVNWIKIGDATAGSKYIEKTAEKIKPEGVSRSRFVKEGDFLLTNSMSFGKPYILKTEGCIHDGWLVISPFVGSYNKDFLYYLISSNYAYSQFSDKAEGAVVSNLNKDKVATSVFPLPPISEQQRIVSKIEKIFEELDKIKEFAS